MVENQNSTYKYVTVTVCLEVYFHLVRLEIITANSLASGKIPVFCSCLLRRVRCQIEKQVHKSREIKWLTRRGGWLGRQKIQCGDLTQLARSDGAT